MLNLKNKQIKKELLKQKPKTKLQNKLSRNRMKKKFI